MDNGKVTVNIDCHVHTSCSCDGLVPPDDVITVAKRKGLHGVAVTDHNSVRAALKLKDMVSDDDFIIIVGEEIKTSEGEITGLFLREEVPPGLSPEETIEKIRTQGGLVSITHPFCRFRKSKLSEEALKRIVDMVDIIEIFNSRNIAEADNRKAHTFAKDHKKAMAVGSDAHLVYEYGKSYVRMEPFDGPEQFKRNLSSAEFTTQKSPLWVHLATKWMKLKKR